MGRRSPCLIIILPCLALLTGCLNTHEERVRVRRDPGIVEKEERRIRPSDYKEFLERMDAERESRRMTLALKTEENWYENTRHAVGATAGSIPEDPWASYEKDRLETLHRNWADDDLPPPEPEKTVLEEAAAAEDEEAEEGEEGEDEDAGDEDAGGDEEEDEYDEDW